MAGEHYFTADPAVAHERHEVVFEALDRQFRLVSASGVFSWRGLDPGTATLLAEAPLPSVTTEGALLDLGCGYGPIATVLATAAPRATVYAIDVNQRALELVRENAAGKNIVAARPDDVPESVGFTQIWSNPPIRVGKAELHELLLRWLPRLAPDGVAWLVVGKNLGGDSLQRWLVEQGYAAERHASRKGFRVLKVQKPLSRGTAAA
ncbi:class I SAM-dependent methyltransferase [Dactylosporangium matsuzakiense]|uniref:16S RNA G1207 methylase RsmC n=1 Tax=Dactylosporangium matsuzakiense TaxID=53360 RepID=A0A9W6KF57_9ACTN|nr:methyltransferase [Dactylosporangium matsuzakiense]UWZ44313.1 methyltransferase [Dactylosporangium matsuzakiense]GLK99534.1 16S RNA G1207 methylase RsmC [Dactylosporangium matsuzakiense]